MCRFDTKNTLVSGNAGDKENLYLGDRKFIFLIDMPEIFSFLLKFHLHSFLFNFFVCLLFFESKNVYSDTESTMRVDE